MDTSETADGNVSGQTFAKADVVAMLQSASYEEVVARTGWSRGSIYRAAMEMNARKTEARIKERTAERKRRARRKLCKQS